MISSSVLDDLRIIIKEDYRHDASNRNDKIFARALLEILFQLENINIRTR